MKQYNLIRIFFTTIFLQLFVSNSLAQTELKASIIQQEIKNYENVNELIYINYGENEFLKDFLWNNKISSKDSLEFNFLAQNLSLSEIRNIFNLKQVKSLIKQIDNGYKEILFAINLSENNNFTFAPVNQIKSNLQLGIPLLSEVNMLNISEPVITSDQNFVLLAYSYGKNNQKFGGIKVYRRKGLNFHFYCGIGDWIE